MALQLTVKELDQEIAKLQEQKAALWTTEKSDVIARIKDAVTFYAITADDLGLGSHTGKKARKSAGTGTPSRQAGRVKYKDDAGSVWSGFGRKPRWYLAALADGKTESDLRA